jgi:hypothetical protein
MFIKLASSLTGNVLTQAGAETILSYEAPTISYLMEAAWSSGGRGALLGVPRLSPAPVGVNIAGAAAPPAWSGVWDHLIYAYMIENTRIYEIFRRVIWEYTHGERLGIPQRDASHQWIRTTEELFYKDASPFSPYNLISRIRPDIEASRRNAYYRMFGMDLNHGREGGPTYPYEKPPAANREFASTIVEFLREFWRAISNARNVLADNQTDVQAILDLSLRLQNMLNARRGGDPTRPNLARDEFVAVSTMSWFHLSVLFNTPIVSDLLATGPSPEERLRLIGERVGVPSHGRSHSYFIIAPLISTLLTEIERGDLDTVPEIESRSAAGPNPSRDDLTKVITHWSMITGRDVKTQRIVAGVGAPVSAPSAEATSAAMPTPSSGASVSATAGNGQRPSGAS